MTTNHSIGFMFPPKHNRLRNKDSLN